MATKYNKYQKSDEPAIDRHQEMTNEFISDMENNKRDGWIHPILTCNQAAYNPMTGTVYSGSNRVSIALKKFDDPRNYTYLNIKQLAEKSGQELFIKKGSKGTPVFKALQVVITGNGTDNQIEKEVSPGDNKITSFFRTKYMGVVFNGSQIQGLEPYIKRENKVNPIEEVELLAKALQEKTGLKIVHSEEGRAYYSSTTHTVHMPYPERFKSTEAYYDTLLHELGHSTGPALGRKMGNGFGSAEYAKEELVAELSSLFMSADLGIPHNANSHENHIAYCESWLTALKNDKNFIFSASSKASRCAEYQLNILNEYKLEHNLVKDTKVEIQDVVALSTQPPKPITVKQTSMAM